MDGVSDKSLQVASLKPFASVRETPSSPLAPGVPTGFMNNFMLMCLLFGLNHSTFVVMLELSSTIVGVQISGVATGMLFLFLALAVGIFAGPLTVKLGPKVSMIISMGLYTTYVACYAAIVYFLCDDGSTPQDVDYATCWSGDRDPQSYRASYETFRSVAWACAIVGGAVGGFGAGWLWTGQGAYYVVCSNIYATCTGTKLEEATAKMIGIFGGFYLLTESLIKVFTFLLIKYVEGSRGFQIDFVCLTALAGVTAFCMCFVDDVRVPQTEPSNDESNLTRSRLRAFLAPLMLMYEEPAAFCLLAYNTFYGFALTFVLLWVARYLQAGVLGPSSVILLSMINSVVGGLAMGPFSSLSNHITKINVVQIGTTVILAYLGIYIAFAHTTRYKKPCGTLSNGTALIQPDYCNDGHAMQSDVFNWESAVALNIMSGLSRAIYEGVFKGVWADYFGPLGKVEAAFSCVTFQMSLGSVVSFFLFPHIGSDAPEWPDETTLIIICMALALPAYLFSALAQYYHRKRSTALLLEVEAAARRASKSAPSERA